MRNYREKKKLKLSLTILSIFHGGCRARARDTRKGPRAREGGEGMKEFPKDAPTAPAGCAKETRTCPSFVADRPTCAAGGRTCATQATDCSHIRAARSHSAAQPATVACHRDLPADGCAAPSNTASLSSHNGHTCDLCSHNSPVRRTPGDVRRTGRCACRHGGQAAVVGKQAAHVGPRSHMSCGLARDANRPARPRRGLTGREGRGRP
jgi:hypothetical protein